MKLAAVGEIENAANFMIDAGWAGWWLPAVGRHERGALRAGDHGVPATPLAWEAGTAGTAGPTRAPSHARPLSIKELASVPRLSDDTNPLVNSSSAARTHPASPIVE
ncbi:hypothetical protein ACIA5A_23950, partial [Micromonospora sp. NPDC051300]|uniref:hypothetical protein n=1 Tax=Micromonospora sp. NPDC051300 TaxID=3364286 RepID=UPI0037AC3764